MQNKLQIAIDYLDLNEATEIVQKALPWIDIFEAGIPLIKSEGISTLRTLKIDHPNKHIVADLNQVM